jgi:hypothetical protein
MLGNLNSDRSNQSNISFPQIPANRTPSLVTPVNFSSVSNSLGANCTVVYGCRTSWVKKEDLNRIINSKTCVTVSKVDRPYIAKEDWVKWRDHYKAFEKMSIVTLHCDYFKHEWEADIPKHTGCPGDSITWMGFVHYIISTFVTLRVLIFYSTPDFELSIWPVQILNY